MTKPCAWIGQRRLAGTIQFITTAARADAGKPNLTGDRARRRAAQQAQQQLPIAVGRRLGRAGGITSSGSAATMALRAVQVGACRWAVAPHRPPPSWW